MQCNQDKKKKKEQEKQLNQYISTAPVVKATNQQAEIHQELNKIFTKKETVGCRCNIF